MAYCCCSNKQKPKKVLDKSLLPSLGENKICEFRHSFFEVNVFIWRGSRLDANIRTKVRVLSGSQNKLINIGGFSNVTRHSGQTPFIEVVLGFVVHLFHT